MKLVAGKPTITFFDLKTETPLLIIEDASADFKVGADGQCEINIHIDDSIFEEVRETLLR